MLIYDSLHPDHGPLTASVHHADDAGPNYLNALEPASLISHFLAHPPQQFQAWTSVAGLPVFRTHFDLLTTADDSLKRMLTKLPRKESWQDWLRIPSCFIGTTVSEYTLFPAELAPARLAEHLQRHYLKHYPLLIVKDIPQHSPLLDKASNAYADALVQACEQRGFITLEGQALAYLPLDFGSIDEYLARLSRGRRKDIRRKLRTREEVTVEVLDTGDPWFARPEVLEAFYALYLAVYRQSEIHFDLLGADFFRAVLQDAGSGGKVFVYRHHGELVGYNLCFIFGDKLVDKYIGLAYPQARALNLYFLSWITNLEYALAHGLKHYVTGWTDPQIKAYLGARFTFTRHAVFIRNPLLRLALTRLHNRFEPDHAWQTAAAHG
jgi:hypothetical protein